jgi:3-methyladenine DNA glycosylase AlkD
MRRQSVLSPLCYARSRKVKPPFNKIIALVKPLLNDPDYYVQKGVGWCLRETGIVYPEKTFVFLTEYHHVITSTAFAAAAEKLPAKQKEQLKLLRKKSRKK